MTAMNNSGGYYRPTFYGGFSVFPPVIRFLLISNGIIWLLTNVLLRPFVIGDYPLSYIVTELFALWPLESGFWPWQLVTYMFLHGDFWHVFFNMLMLWMFGMEIENLWGSRKFVVFYLLSGAIGGAAHFFLVSMMGDRIPTVGASAAVYGVLVAFAMFFPNRLVYIYFLLPVKAKYLIAAMVGLDLFYGITQVDGSVAYFAHLGGAGFGFLYMLGELNKIPARSVWYDIKQTFMSPKRTSRQQDIRDARFYDIGSGKEMKQDDEVTQEVIDEILDKISRNGYSSLTAEEKKLLNEASKNIN